MRERHKYKVGDVVRIVSVDNCVFGKNSEMESRVVDEVVISSVVWDGQRKCDIYHFRDYAGHWLWCDNCFAPAVDDLPEFDVESADSLLNLLIL